VLSIEAGSEGAVLRLSVTNTGVGLHPANGSSTGNGVGLTNVQDRLRMHYGDDQSLTIAELEGGLVQVVIRLPLRFAARPIEQTTGYGV
jgi:LytS/YehU family sensor histidine kinase